MTKLILWFFGQSGAGKATLMRQLRDGNVPPRLTGDLSAHARRVEVCGVSCDTEMNNDWRQRERHLPQLVRRQAEGLPGTAALMIKGQNTDLYPHRWSSGVFRAVTRTTPSCVHRIVFVWCEPGEVYRRWQQRGQKKGGDYWRDQSMSSCRQELEDQLKWIGSLRSKFRVVCVDATHADYKVRDWPT